MSKKMYYHLTTPKNWKKIKVEGLKGGDEKTGKWKEDVGWLFMVDTDDKDLWNGISSNHLTDGRKKGVPNWYTKFGNPMLGILRHGKPYVVIGIKRKYFKDNGFEIKGDDTMDITNLFGNHKSVRIDNHIIPPSHLTMVYEGITNQWKYEVEDRWKWLSSAKDLPKEQFVIEDGIIGKIRYHSRKRKNTISYLLKPPSLIDKLFRDREKKIKLKEWEKKTNENTPSNHKHDLLRYEKAS